jgi:glycosyltransferase involved in cell wall biosynthesis
MGEVDPIKDYLAEADVLVLPSYREGTPRTLLEAAAMAKPMIATDVPGCREVVRDGRNGFLCKAKSKDSLAKSMRLMLALSEEERFSMGQAARAWVEEHFDENIVLEAYNRRIKHLLDPKSLR